jgi:hypothetical protein
MPHLGTFSTANVTFDDDHAVANAGLILPATLLDHLVLEPAADEVVSVGYRPGRKDATAVHGILAGAECIDDLGVLRAGATERVLPTKPIAPSTVGTWLRSFTFGHITGRQGIPTASTRPSPVSSRNLALKDAGSDAKTP